MKRWFSLLLSMTMILTTVLGDISWAVAEETEAEAVSASIEAEVPLSTDAGESGLVVDVGEIEIVEAQDAEVVEEAIPVVEAEVPAEDAEIPAGDAVIPDEEAGIAEPEAQEPAEDAAPSDKSDAQETGASEESRTVSELPDFDFGYVKTLDADIAVLEAAGAEAIATIGKGAVVLCVGREGDFARVTFNTESGVVSGCVSAEALMPLTDEEIAGFMDEAAEYEAVVLYNDDINLPLSNLECAFVGGDEASNDEAASGEAVETPTQDAESEVESTTGNETGDATADAPAAEDEAGDDLTDAPAAEDGAGDDLTDAPAAEDGAVEDGEAVADTPVTGDETDPDADTAIDEGIAPETTEEVEILLPSVFAVVETDSNQVEQAAKLIPESASLAAGESFTLKVMDGSGNAVESGIVYTTTNGDVATVNDAGIVTAVAGGNCNITVTVNGMAISCPVTVCDAPESIAVAEALNLFEGQTQKIDVTFVPETAASLLSYESSNAAVASVDENGVVTANVPGSAVITVKTRSGSMADCKVTVAAAPAKINLSHSELSMSVKMKAVLTASITDADGEAMDVDYIFTYIPADPEKPAIELNSATGEITAINEDTAQITVTAKNGFGIISGADGAPIQATCTVKVSAAPAKVKLNASKGSIGYKEYFDGLVATAVDASGNEVPATFTYKTSNKSYVTVDEDGVIYGKKTGSAYVYAYAQNGKYARCKVTVKKAPSSVTVKPASLTLSAGGMVYSALKPSVNSGAACNTYTYSGYDEKIISVSENGVVTSKNAGSTTITVASYNGKKKSVPVSVLNPPSEVYFNEAALTIGVGQVAQVSAYNRNASGESVPASYTYSVAAGDEGILSVDSVTGEIVGLSAGWATVLVSTHNGVTTGSVDGATVTTTCKVRVLEAPKDLAFAVTGMNIGYKEKYYNIMDYVRLVMPDGETLITPEAAEEQELYAASYSFKSSNKNYVTVDSNGVIYGKKAGKSAYVTITSHNGRDARIKVSVKKAPTKVTVSPTKLSMGANGMQYKLTAKVNSGAYTNTYTYTSSNTDVVIVDKNTGLLTSVNPGTATITVKSYNGKKATCKVTVYGEPKEIRLSKTTALVGMGSRMTLSASAVDANGNTTYANYTYSVEQSGDYIGLDAATGKITARNKGEAIVTVKAHNGVNGSVNESGAWAEAKCVVRVVDAPVALKLSSTGITIGYKETFTGIPGTVTLVAPEGETESMANLSYKSSRTSYVTVNASTGSVYGKKVGYSYITITPDNGAAPVKVKVTVKKAPTKVTVSPTKLSMGANGMQYKLTAKVNSGAYSRGYTYSSNNTNAVIVDKNTGLLTSVNPGTATITVKSYNGKKATCKVTVYPAPAQVNLPEYAGTMGVGSTMTLKPTVVDADGNATYANYVYSVEQAANVISIDANGKITALEKGNAVVSVRTHNNINGYAPEKDKWTELTYNVRVVAAPAALKLSGTGITIGLKETYTGIPGMVTLVAPEGETESMANLSYKSSRTSYATVNATTGAVYGKKAGYSYITITPDNGADPVKVKVTVKKAPTKATLNTTKITLSEGGQTYQLKPSVNSGAACSTYTWKSSDTSVATVSANGLVTTVGTGTATITVTPYKGTKATCTVTVVEAPAQVFLPGSITVAKGQKAKIEASVCGIEGAASMANYTYATQDARISVNPATGEVVGLAVTGDDYAEITVRTHNGVSTHYDENGVAVETVCRVKVIEAPATIELNMTGATIGVGQTVYLEPVMKTADGEIMNGGDFTYKVTSGSSYASVSAEGAIKGKKVGTAYVQVASADGTTSQTCKVVVKKAPTSVSMTPASGTLGVGQKDKFTVKLSSGSAGSYTLTSSNTNVAVVESDGTVTAVGVGSATITVKTYNGKKDTSKLTVKEGPEFLDFNSDYIELFDETTGTYKLVYFEHMLPGTTFKLTYKPEAYTVGKAVNFVSEDPSIASVTSDGTITAVSEGCTAILVESSSGVLEMCFVVVESGETPFEFLDEDGSITLALGETIPMPEVSNVSDMYNMFIEYGMSGSCAEIVLDENGLYWLKGVATGTGTLHARSVTAKGASISVTVAAAPSDVEIDMPEVVYVGESAPVNVVYKSLGSYTLTVDDEEIAAITTDGQLKALAVGDVTVTATMQTGISASKTVSLRNKPEYVELAAESAVLIAGQTMQIEPMIDVNAHTEYTFVSSDNEVAEVSATGVVTAKAPGTARITVRTAVPGVFAVCDITVEAEMAPIAQLIDPESLRLKVGGEGGTIEVKVDSATNVTVNCDNEAIFESFVYESAMINIGKPIAAGQAIITVTTESGETATCTVTVYEDATAITAGVANVTIAAGETANADIAFAPETAWADVTAQTTDANVATADASGVITAVAPGEAQITFTAEGVDTPAVVNVKVVHAPEIIRPGVESVEIAVGSSVKLDAPELLSTQGVSGGSYTWAIGDESIATIGADGTLTAIAAGTTAIKVRAYNGVCAYVPVTVWPQPTEIMFTEESILMAVNETVAPVVLSEEGAVVNATLNSSDSAIVSVNEDGSLVGVATGTATITATVGTLTAQMTVQVCAVSQNVTLNAEDMVLGVKERFTVKATLDAGAASAGLEIASSEPTVVSVGKDGVITALRPGTATITATAFGGASDSFKVTVMAAPTGVALLPGEINGNVLEDGAQLNWYFDSDSQGGSVRFESDDETIASVDENGYVTFHKAGWTTIGIVTYNGYTDTVEVTVHRVPEKIAFTYPEIVIQTGDTVLNPVVMTGNSYANYTLASDNETVVQVDADGYFNALSAGTATVKLTTAFGLSTECSVTVVDKLAGMKISNESLELALGEEATLTVSFADENAVANVRYVSSNSSIATVDEFTGRVKAIKKGSCTIYAQTLDGTNADTCTVTVNGPRYRMFMAYEYFGTEFKNDLAFSQNNVNSMKATFANSRINGVAYDIHTMKNPSKNSLLSGLSSYFADSNDSDVNVIYLCSHGHSNINGTSVNGYTQYGLALQGYKTSYDLDSPYYYITATELYACVSQIKGKVVLILDSCYSGQFIHNMKPRLDQVEDNRIAVLTAVQGNYNASYYDVSSTTKAVDFFTYFLMYGVGYDEKKDKHDYKLRADSNGSGKISLNEFFNYGKTATSSYVSKSSTYKASWFHGNRKQVPQSYIKGTMGDLVIYDPK